MKKTNLEKIGLGIMLVSIFRMVQGFEPTKGYTLYLMVIFSIGFILYYANDCKKEKQ